MNECECRTWACEDAHLVNDNPHHPRCEHYREIVFWDMDGNEYLSHSDKDEAIESILERNNQGDGTLEICGFARRKKPGIDRFASELLDAAIEDLDCNYDLGSPDNASNSTKEQMSAARAFAKAILDDYTPWACEIVTRQTIDVKAWIKENRPDWLGLDPGKAIDHIAD